MESETEEIHSVSSSDAEVLELPPAKRAKFEEKKPLRPSPTIDPAALEDKF
jgi:hypothetical protein